VPHQKVGERVRSARRRLGLTQADLAKAIGSNRSAITHIERGQAGFSVNFLRKLSRALHLSTDAILGEVELPKPPLEDRRLLRRLQKAQGLSRRQKLALLKVVDGFLAKAK
jgi:transcriptional regulator with XRE-family HTH domain